MTKKIISDQLAELRKYNFKVFNFNSQKKFNSGMKDFVDYVIIGKGFVHFIEVKLKATKDKMKSGQSETRDLLVRAEKRNNTARYHLADETNIDEIINSIYYCKIF